MDTDNTSLKYIAYARKSSEDNKERQAKSLPEQIDVFEDMMSKDRLEIIDILQESKTAHVPGRPIFNNLLERIREGEANAILIWHENRLSRNAYDAGQIIYLMDEGKLVEVKTSTRIYHDTPSDKFVLALELSISKKDSDDKSIVVKRGLDKKCRDGWRPGVAPQGYLNDKITESGFRRILTDKERHPFIKKIFGLFHQGIPVAEIHHLAKDVWHYRTPQKKRSGGCPLSISTIYSILSNPFYCGKFEYPVGSNIWWEGKHEPAVRKEIFEEIQIKLGRRNQYKLNQHKFPYKGISCGFCDGTVVAEEKWQCICSNCKFKFSLTKANKDSCPHCRIRISEMANAKILHYVHYRCKHRKDPNCQELGLREDKLEEQVMSELDGIEISLTFLDWAVRQIQKMGENDKDFQKERMEVVIRATGDCKKRLDNLLQLKISPANSDGSLLNDSDYKVQKEVLEKELKALEGQSEGDQERAEKADRETARGLSFAALARKRFTDGDFQIKRDIFMGLGSHLTLQDRIVRFDAPKYLFKIKEMKKEVPKIAERVAPNKLPEYTPQMEQYFASIPAVLRGQESRLAWKIMLKCYL